jgi:dTDP-4-dehydrorhamnose reductase
MTKRHLILGGSSFVGRRLYKRLGPARALITFNANPVADGIRFDSTSMGLSDIVPDPDAIDQAILLLGDTQPDSCVADRERSHLVNVEGIKRVINQLNDWGIRPVFTSSEFVFDGAKGEYMESDAPNPILLYGEQKLEIERYLDKTTDDFAVLRLAKVYGDDPDDGTLFGGLMKTARAGGEALVASDQRFSPVYVGDVCDAILAAVDGILQGVYHVAGSEALTRLECMETAITALERHHPIDLTIETCSIHDFDLPEKRPVDVSMKPDKFVAETGMALRTATESCRILAEPLPVSH